MAKKIFIVINGSRQRQVFNVRPGDTLLFKRGEPGARAEPLRTVEPSDGNSEIVVHVDSPHISQSHLQLRCVDDTRMVVKDMNSLNGSYIRLQPYQEYEQNGDFELQLGPDVVIQQQNALGEGPPDIGRIASADDLVGYLKAQLKNYIVDITINASPSGDSGRQSQKYTRLPLLERRSYLIVSWRQGTFNLSLERFLKSTVALFNTGVSNSGEEAWTFLATSQERQDVLRLARRVAPTEATVLICGQSGAGKDVLARDIHRHSARSKGPFVAINCSALPKDLVEGELFGSVVGSFTGAVERKGLFEQANHGTLFLDEIGELPLDVQPKLLRALECRSIRRVGGTKEQPTNVRIIAATNRDLEKMVLAGTFREDLFFRLQAVPLIVPDLRPIDIRALVPTLLGELAQQNFAEVSLDDVQRLSNCAEKVRWRGNVRQLKNVLQRYLTLRDPSRPVEENWDFIQSMAGSKSLDGVPPVAVQVPSSPSIEAEPESDEIPEGAMEIRRHVDNLIFLRLAAQVFSRQGRGALAELGRQTDMTGAGAAVRLRRLNITTEPTLDPALIATRIEEELRALAPYRDFLRRLLML